MKVREYLRPTCVQEAVSLKRAHGPSAAYLAGGTDLMVVRPSGVEVLIDIRHLGLNGVTVAEDLVRIGGAARLRDAERAVSHLGGGMLTRAFRETAPWLIRNAASVAGNIGNASPAADAIPALMALNATLEVQGEIEEQVSVEDVLRGPHQTNLGDRLITGIVVPVEAERRGVFIKLARSHSDIAQVNVAVSARAVDGVLQDVVIVVGAAAPVPVRVQAAEDIVNNQYPSARILKDVEDAVRMAVRPITDWRASAEYRRRVSGVLARRALTQLTTWEGSL